jgi:hypothetical protein
MPYPTYINGDWLVFSEQETFNTEGVDTLAVTLRGRLDELGTESAKWPRGSVATALGYPNMYLQTKVVTDAGNWGQIDLNFEGYLSTDLANPIGITDDLTLQAATLVSDEPGEDGSAQNVQVQYFAQQASIRWIYRGINAPVSPQYPANVPTDVPTGVLFGHFPASYTGTLQKKNVGRLTSFTREELATGIWAVTEVWVTRIEPDS